MANEKEELLLQVKAAAQEVLDKAGFAKKEDVLKSFNEKVEGLDIEGLKSLKPADLIANIKNLAGEVEKIKNRRNDSPMLIDEKFLKDLFIKSMASGENGAPGRVESFMKNNREGFITLFDTKAAATMTTQNTITEGTYPYEMIESVNMIEEVFKKRRGYDFIFDVADRMPMAEIEKYTTWLEEGDEQGAFAVVAEGGLKPLVSTNLVRNVATAKKVAGKMVVTEEFAKWRKKAWPQIQALLRDKLVRDYKALALVDLNAVAASYVGTSLDNTFADPNDIDAIGAVAAQIQSLDFMPDVLVLNPVDLWRIKLSKNLEGTYLYLSIPGPNGDQVLGFNVVVSTRQTAGSFTLAESKLFKIEEENVTVRIGYGINTTSSGGNVTSVEHDFDHNRFRVIMEMFYKPFLPTVFTGSIVKASFATVKAALLDESGS